ERTAEQRVAVARGFFEAFVIGDGDPAALVTKQALALHRAQNCIDGGTARANHLPNKFLSDFDRAALDAVADHQQPVRERRLGLVQLVAGGYLAERDALRLY